MLLFIMHILVITTLILAITLVMYNIFEDEYKRRKCLDRLELLDQRLNLLSHNRDLFEQQLKLLSHKRDLFEQQLNLLSHNRDLANQNHK